MRLGRRILSTAALAASFYAAVAMEAQSQEPLKPPPFQVRTDLVTIDVTVLDRDRRPVRGLTAADFVIVDGDQRRAPTGFTAVDLPPRVRHGPGSSSGSRMRVSCSTCPPNSAPW